MTTYAIEAKGKKEASMRMAEEIQALSQQREDLLRLVIDTVPIMAWSVRPDGVVDFLNQRWLDYTGLSLEQYVQDPLGPIQPDDIPRVLEKWRASMALGEPYEDEMRLRGADGEYRWFLVRTVPLRDGQGNIVKWYGTSTDIEDRKRAEDALRESEQRFAAFMDNLPGYAWMKDLQGRYVYINQRVSGLPGYQSLGKTDAQIWPADLTAEYRANDEQVIAAKKPLHTLEHYLHEGKQRYMLGSKFPIFDKTGAVALVGGAGVDITERIEAEDALRESEEKFRQLAENIGEVFWMTTPTMDEVLYVSPAYESVWGRSLESVRQRPQSFLDAIHSEDRERVVGILEGQRQQRSEVEYRIVRPDGSVRWIRDRGFPVKDASGKVYRIAGVAEDITERKQVEMALQKNEQLLSETQVLGRTGSWEHNLVTGEIVNTEENLRLFFGDDRSKGARFEDFTEVVHQDDREYVSARHAQLLAEGGPRDIEYRVVWPDGTVHVLFGRATVVRDAAGRALRVYGTNVDITERKRAENALRDSGVQLQALSRRLVELQESERKELARELHDRVGQSLTALKINLDILQSAPDSRGTEIRARVDDSVALLESTMDAIENVMSELRPPMLDDHGLAAALDWHSRNFSKRTGIVVAVRVGESALRPAPQIEIAFFRIAQEALNNVAKHARAHHVEIALDYANGECVMSIRDDGIGFDGVQDPSDKPKPRLGMVTMRERAQAVGGRFEVRALPGRGTQLTVRVSN
jgi:PAS domain S-box-containing protein